MTSTFSGTLLKGACFALALTTFACKDRTEDASTTTSGGAVAEASAIEIAEVDLGKGVQTDKTIRDETDDFARRDTVYASVRTTGTATSATITARWTFQDGQVVDERTETISPTGDANTVFFISQPSGLPAGNYTLSVLLNGAEAQKKEFEVK
ncbi:MAG TPA: hypothetical protein VJ802_05695 [Gemmatimonadaceae bacterium]|nr:hypothetical protein [Gemmatimonadaceae bacterium]